MQETGFAWQGFCIIILYVMMSVFGTASNIAASYFMVQRRRVTNFTILLLSLAHSDLLSSLFAPIAFVHDLLTVEKRWHLGSLMCRFLPAVVVMLLSASSWSIVAIGIERLRMLSKPLQNRTPTIKSYAKLALVWVISGIISIPYTFAWRFDGARCEEVFDHIRRQQMFFYLTSLNMVIWAIPLLFLIISYGMSSRTLKKSMFTHENSRGVSKRLQKNRKALKRMVILVCSFFLLNLPYSIFFCVIWHKRVFKPEDMTPRFVSKLNIWNCFLFTSCLISSCVNPWIYGNIYKYVPCCKQRFRRRSTNIPH